MVCHATWAPLGVLDGLSTHADARTSSLPPRPTYTRNRSRDCLTASVDSFQLGTQSTQRCTYGVVVRGPVRAIYCCCFGRKDGTTRSAPWPAHGKRVHSPGTSYSKLGALPNLERIQGYGSHLHSPVQCSDTLNSSASCPHKFGGLIPT